MTKVYDFVSRKEELDRLNSKDFSFGDEITFVPTNPGYKFIGWYNSEDEKIETMPASDISLYPKWQIKSVLSLTPNKQTKSIDDPKQGYAINLNLQNFIVEYYVDNSYVKSSNR